ncbi:glycosyltransferase 6-like [Fagus crenata]
MSKSSFRNKPCLCFTNGFLFLGGALLLLLLLWTFLSFSNPFPNFEAKPNDPDSLNCAMGESETKHCDSPEKSFYDDPELSYSIEKPVKNWDAKRRDWLKHHPSLASGARDRILVVTGSQPFPCKNPIGDHLLLRLFKNKVDYCRIHGYEIFYNNAYLQPKMDSYWAKIPVVRAAMLAHPEVEWIWWVDSDAVFTDMEFKVPLERYKDHNLVVHGWPDMVYHTYNKSWTGLNAGVFLIRNCQWSMDLMHVWSHFGPNGPNYKRWGQILTSTFKDKPYPLPDDQSSLIYLLFKLRKKWGYKTYIESDYNLEGYWIELVKTYDNVTEGYIDMEIRAPTLRRRHAEKLSEYYAALREPYLEDLGYKSGNGRRPFVTHFTGCQQCSGDHNAMYVGDTCWNEMERALNFADNQVLRKYGFMHPDLLKSSLVSVVPFDYPA